MQGKGRDALPLISEIYGWFTEGFDTYDLKAARTLLAEMQGASPHHGQPPSLQRPLKKLIGF
jgi:hypothetical protein